MRFLVKMIVCLPLAPLLLMIKKKKKSKWVVRYFQRCYYILVRFESSENLSKYIFHGFKFAWLFLHVYGDEKKKLYYHL